MLTDGAREYLLVIDEGLNPGHEIIDVLRGADLDWFLNFHAISPEVLVLWACTHDGAFLRSTEFGDGSVKQVCCVEKIDDIDGQPFAQIFARRKLHGG